eukprot:695430-Prymnesium_polylepis.1
MRLLRLAVGHPGSSSRPPASCSPLRVGCGPRPASVGRERVTLFAKTRNAQRYAPARQNQNHL